MIGLVCRSGRDAAEDRGRLRRACEHRGRGNPAAPEDRPATVPASIRNNMRRFLPTAEVLEAQIGPPRHRPRSRRAGGLLLSAAMFMGERGRGGGASEPASAVVPSIAWSPFDRSCSLVRHRRFLAPRPVFVSLGSSVLGGKKVWRLSETGHALSDPAPSAPLRHYVLDSAEAVIQR